MTLRLLKPGEVGPPRERQSRNSETPHSLQGLESIPADTETHTTNSRAGLGQECKAMQAAATEEQTPDPASVVRVVPSAPPAPETLSAGDQEALRRYVQRDHLFAPHSSTFGAMIERVALMSFGSRNCTRCGGTKSKTGRGFVPRSERIPYPEQLRRYRLRVMKAEGMSATSSEAQAVKLRLLGLDAYTWRVIAEFMPELPALQCRECPECGGRGVVARTTRSRSGEPITARPNGGSRRGGRVSGDGLNEDDLKKRGKVDSRLARARLRCPEAAGVLEAWFRQPKGREMLIALWPFTKQGRKLLRQNSLGIDPRDFFQNRIDAQRQNPEPHRAWTHEQCDREAAEIFALACRTYNEVAA